jgi:hypothetical protein
LTKSWLKGHLSGSRPFTNVHKNGWKSPFLYPVVKLTVNEQWNLMHTEHWHFLCAADLNGGLAALSECKCSRLVQMADMDRIGDFLAEKVPTILRIPVQGWKL